MRFSLKLLFSLVIGACVIVFLLVTKVKGGQPLEGTSSGDPPILQDSDFVKIVSPWFKEDKTEHLLFSTEALSLQHNAKSRDNLIAGLAASPEWCLRQGRWGIVANRREFVEGRWTTSLNGYLTTYVNGKVHRLLMQICVVCPLLMMDEKASIDLIEAARKNNFPITRNEDPDNVDYNLSSCWATYNGLTFFVEASSPINTSDVAQNALVYLANTVAALAKNISFQDSNLSLSLEYPEFSIEEGPQDGVYNVFATVNPGQQGITYLRITDPDTNLDIVGEYLFTDSNEIVGWSADNKRFLYNRSFVVDTVTENYMSDKEYIWTLYFSPADGSSDKILHIKKKRLLVWRETESQPLLRNEASPVREIPKKD